MKARILSLFVAAVACVVCAATAAPIPELTAKERAARLKALPEEDRKWIEDFVAPIIMPEERNVFLQLTEQHQRDTFEEEFWKRREQPGLTWPLGPGYRNRYEDFREAAQTTYDGIGSDAGNVVIRRGEPDAVEEYRDCNEVFRNVEVWTYGRARGNTTQTSLQLVFYRPTMGAPRKLWYPALPDQEILAPSACLRTIAEACRPPGTQGRPVQGCPPTAVPQTCDAACSLVGIIEGAKVRGTAEVTMAMTEPPKVNTEGLDKFAESFPTMPSAGAKPLTVESPGSQKEGEKPADKPAEAPPPTDASTG